MKKQFDYIRFDLVVMEGTFIHRKHIKTVQIVGLCTSLTT